MRRIAIGLLLACGVASGAAWAAPAQAPALPAFVAHAASDPARAADRTIDARRHGPEIAAFAGVRPGAKVADLIPGGGYFTRLFSRIAGPSGHVYAIWPNEYDKESHPDSDKLRALGRQPAWGNISVLVQPANAFAAPEKLDVVFTSQNYHDYPDKFMGPTDPMVLNRAVYRALKPGGVFLIIDHIAQAGSGVRDTDTLHRIDPAIVKAQLRAAGFEYAGKIDVLRNPVDDHRLKVFDPKVRGRTDQFVFKFVKPARAR